MKFKENNNFNRKSCFMFYSFGFHKSVEITSYWTPKKRGKEIIEVFNLQTWLLSFLYILIIH